jgi:CBS domain-containing protein
MRVKDVMTPGVIGVEESASLWDALSLMTTRHVSALIVFDAIGAPVGVLSEGDLMRRAEFGAEKREPRWLEFLIGGGRAARDYAHSHGRHVHEIMTRHVLAVEAEAELAEAIDLMLERKVRRLLVVKDSEPVGVISRSDLVRALMRALPPETTRPDAEIKAAIEAALAREEWAPVATVHVAVHDGVATLEGTIPDGNMREGLKTLVENVPGVRKVHDKTAWIEPNSGAFIPSPGQD